MPGLSIKTICHMDICLFPCLMDKMAPCFKMFPKGRHALSSFFFVLFFLLVPSDFVYMISALIGLFSAAVEQNYRIFVIAYHFFSNHLVND